MTPSSLFLAIICISVFSTKAISQIDSCGFKPTAKEKRKFLEALQRTPNPATADELRANLEVRVVFHIISNGSSWEVSDDDIAKELSELNRDFQLLNSDTSQVEPQFKHLIGNPRIAFLLANVDPQGNQTTGILRKQTSFSTFTFRRNRQIFQADQIWDPSKYLNVYIGSIRNGKTRGYVNSLPWTNRSTDAIALHHGDVGKGTRLLTHETGHWFGLWHITEGGCSSENDDILDTPRQASFTSGCPNSAKLECGNTCFFRNYMDYSDCRVAFTEGQCERIRQVFSLFRSDLFRISL